MRKPHFRTYFRYNASTDFIERAQNFHFDARPRLAMRLIRKLLPHLGGRLVDVITRVFAVLYGVEQELGPLSSRGFREGLEHSRGAVELALASLFVKHKLSNTFKDTAGCHQALGA